ncbi:MAG: glycosyltransferase family 2 protein [Firmicutes bacterium]|nr:glycosyltransferase family 2 protein [Bacillota bacterium]
MRKPLVSVLIPNYNYEKYLEECLESVLAQTYDNLEVIISDNQSTDDSYEIMAKYRKKFLDRNIWYDILQNKRNLGSGGNTEKCFHRSEGKYFIWLSSDDNLRPDAIEKMAKALDLYPSAGCVMAHRNEVDDTGLQKETAPFYNQNCFIPGENQAAVYMMAGIAVSSQILFRKISYLTMLQSKMLRFQVAGDWYDNFMMACVGDVVYLKEALTNYRIHNENETSASELNLVGVFEHYNLIHAFCSIADSFGMTRPQSRYEEAIKKLGYMCLRYTRKMIINEEYAIAKKYLKLSTIFYDEIEYDSQYLELNQCLQSENPVEFVRTVEEGGIFVRRISYEPPEGSIPITELE